MYTLYVCIRTFDKTCTYLYILHINALYTYSVHSTYVYYGVHTVKPVNTSAHGDIIYIHCEILSCRPLDTDRFMTPDIEATTKLLREGKVSHVI